jgi:hypothetical protein
MSEIHDHVHHEHSSVDASNHYRGQKISDARRRVCPRGQCMVGAIEE